MREPGEVLADFKIPGSPLAQPRPRGYIQMTAGAPFVKMYVPKLRGESEVAGYFKSIVDTWDNPDAEARGWATVPMGSEEEPLHIQMRFYGPHGARDLDNIVKLYLDHMVREKIISEDKWKVVRRLEAEAFPETKNKRTLIRIRRYV